MNLAGEFAGSGACFFVASPPNIPGGVAIIQLNGDIDAAFARLGIAPVPPGRIAVRDLMGVDQGVVARWGPECAHLTPHGGVAIRRVLVETLLARGVRENIAGDPRVRYPEAADLTEARMLAALADAASPLAIDLLLDQPRRWREREGAAAERGAIRERSAVLSRLIRPPLVVAMGPSNIGKSTLVNELAGRNVAIVADEPGTTRDHVGVTLDLCGLVVRFVDTPGLRADPDPAEREAQDLARALAERADLLVSCADSTAAPPEFAAHGNVIRAGLRADLGPARSEVDVVVSVRRSTGLREFAALVRERLVPERVLDDPGPWEFWSD
ncbi:tRNA modification GTPase MnmE [Phycisphaerales bacterium]|nr:tRNA modification GTPase MnmE [Phycisphaerales bacterium]